MSSRSLKTFAKNAQKLDSGNSVKSQLILKLLRPGNVVKFVLKPYTTDAKCYFLVLVAH